MKDFTFKAYRYYISLIKNSFQKIITFDEYFRIFPKPDIFCILRHDVDRKPENALKIAFIEHILDVKATYYFRTKSNCFKADIIKKISDLGHEIGYHYESLSDTNGNFDLALIDFETNLEKLRKIAPINTISMHGRPLKKIDNRDLWKDEQKHNLLKSKFNILGEIYLDIDYSDIAYISDTGRNWESGKSNIRDKVNSNINLNFKKINELINFLEKPTESKLIFQTHPERWTDNPIEYKIQSLKDTSINIIKRILNY